MKLADSSRALLEEFFRSHTGDARLRLPRLHFHADLVALLTTRALRVDAVTFGRLVLIAPHLLTRGEDGRLRAPAPLVAHEAAHAIQFRRDGGLTFVLRYVGQYVRGLRVAGSLGRECRDAAYLAISYEVEAREAEAAFAAWLVSRS